MIGVYPLSGGAGLNLKVVNGTSTPSSPKENTVWINTDTAISSYVFSATEPASPVSGMVWLKTGANSASAMNIDKKNTVMLYLIGCMQYISGAWVDKAVQVYVGGKWNSVVIDSIISNGVLMKEMTAMSKKYSSSAQASKNANGTTVTQADGHVSIAGTSDGFGAGYILTDLTNAKEIVIEGTFEMVSASANYHKLAVWSDVSGTYLTTYMTASAQLGTLGATLDVSSLTGGYYIGITTYQTKANKVTNFFTR